MRFAIVLLLLACGGSSSEEPVSNADEAAERSTDRDRAIEVARAMGVSEGYAEDEYELTSAERVTEGSFEGRWLVSFEHVAPAPPGGHYGVYVDPATWQGELMHGE